MWHLFQFTCFDIADHANQIYYDAISTHTESTDETGHNKFSMAQRKTSSLLRAP